MSALTDVQIENRALISETKTKWPEHAESLDKKGYSIYLKN